MDMLIKAGCRVGRGEFLDGKIPVRSGQLLAIGD
jgi:hypothetical protein